MIREGVENGNFLYTNLIVGADLRVRPGLSNDTKHMMSFQLIYCHSKIRRVRSRTYLVLIPYKNIGGHSTFSRSSRVTSGV